MQYQWDKILAPEEKIQKEYTISARYRNAVTVIIGICGAAVAFSSMYAAIGIFILGGIYWLYLKNAKHYGLTNKRLILVQSFLGSSIISIDYNQITDIEIEQSFLDQIAGWGTIKMNTAGTREPDIRLSIIDNPQEIKQSLDEIRDNKTAKDNY